MNATAQPNHAARLIRRRNTTIGPYSPLMYAEPLHLVRGEGVWLTDAEGEVYLDAYNNVPHVGHANRRVVEAVGRQSRQLNVHTRYLNERILDYSESLLSTFKPKLNRIFYTNSGSEANELAIRIARQRTGARGMIVTDSSYHGNTITLAEITTALPVQEPLGSHVRPIHIPDLDTSTEAESEVLRHFRSEVEAAIADLQDGGHGLAALLIDPILSTEGLPRVPKRLMSVLAERVRAAGGLVIADEVQSGFGRLGDAMWGHDAVGLSPDLVTLGKPMGNGHPIGAVVTTSGLLEEFGRSNLYFNTFAGNPVSAAAGIAVLEEMQERDLIGNAAALGKTISEVLAPIPEKFHFVQAVKGRGLYFGLEIVDGKGAPDAETTRALVEAMRARHVLINRVGPGDNVLKIRPPMVFSQENFETLTETLWESLDEIGQTL